MRETPDRPAEERQPPRTAGAARSRAPRTSPENLDPVSMIVQKGASEPVRISGRLRAGSLLIAAAVIVVGALSLNATSTSSTTQDSAAQPRQRDQAVRDLQQYGGRLRDGGELLPPGSGTLPAGLSATQLSDDLWRITVLSREGVCWQILATTGTPPQDPQARELPRAAIAVETDPYPTEPIHCTANLAQQ